MLLRCKDWDGKLFTRGSVYQAEQHNTIPESWVVTGNTGASTSIPKSTGNFEIVKLLVQSVSGDTKSYSFEIRSETQIDFQKIADDLTWDKPLAIIEIEGNDLVYVQCAQCVVDKTERSRDAANALNSIAHLADFSLPIPRELIKHVQKAIAAVRAAKYDNPCNATVTVTPISC